MAPRPRGRALDRARHECAIPDHLLRCWSGACVPDHAALGPGTRIRGGRVASLSRYPGRHRPVPLGTAMGGDHPIRAIQSQQHHHLWRAAVVQLPAPACRPLDPTIELGCAVRLLPPTETFGALAARDALRGHPLLLPEQTGALPAAHRSLALRARLCKLGAVARRFGLVERTQRALAWRVGVRLVIESCSASIPQHHVQQAKPCGGHAHAPR